LLKRAFSF
ncbi:Single-stranded-DNA-specific exonuclease RecJ, partial [Haemophilus influenzae]